MSVALAEQPPVQQHEAIRSYAFHDGYEERKSFNVLASVNMMRADIREIGEVRFETKERVRDEELSLLSEGVDRVACTDFPLKRIGSDLMYLKRGEWLSYTAMLLEGREVARREADADFRKRFLAEDSVADLVHGLAMRNLKPGEQHVWVSPYRYDIEEQYGKEFMRDKCGRFPDRQMGFIYRAACNQAGDVVLQSHTVDRSDVDAFAAVMTQASTDPTADIDAFVDTYDDVLEAKHGQKFFAGRLDAERRENAWQTILAQEDLIRYFLNGLETIARSSAQGTALEVMTKEHMYGVWAAFKNRIAGKNTPSSYAKQGMPLGTQLFFEQARLRHEVQNAFKQFAEEGRVMVGCGGSIKVLSDKEGILNADPSDAFSSIFGSDQKGKDGDCEFISKTCPKCGEKNARTKCTRGKYVHIPKGCSS